jgi:hypothetical protein
MECTAASRGIDAEADSRGATFPIQAAKSLFLQPPSDHSPQQLLAQSRRRRSSEHRPPASPKGMKRKRTQASDLDLDRGRLYRLPHGYALDWSRPVAAGALPATIRYTRSPSAISDSSLSPSFLRTAPAKKPHTVVYYLDLVKVYRVEAVMTYVLHELLLYCCLAAFVTGIVLAAATLIS